MSRVVNTIAHLEPRRLFRDREAAVANSLALGWTCAGWLGSFALMGAHAVVLNAVGVLLCAHTMVLAAYLIHEAAHQTLFAARWANTCAGEAMNFIAGSAYASFERIRHMHIRHHLDRADLTCFDFKALMRRRPAVAVTRLLERGIHRAKVEEEGERLSASSAVHNLATAEVPRHHGSRSQMARWPKPGPRR